jgi:aminoglycoside phosphotransferase (APT) family kinase protein
MLIDASLVQQLVAGQFPKWADLPVKPVEIGGHDNRTFHLGCEMSVRMPSAKQYAAHVRLEHEWLPKIGPRLSLPVPIPLGKGVPGLGYPWPWTVNEWIQGENASIERISDLSEFAKDLANFLNTLQSIDTTAAPEPGQHNFFRGGELSVYDSETRECIEALQDVIDVSAATSIWESALEVKWDQPPVWIHGDVAEGNLLVDSGRLCAVIDFGQLTAGDPSCDVTIAWTFFSGPSRKAFRTELAVDEATWVRGRGWGLWKALLQLRTHRAGNIEAATKAKRVIRDILAD